MGGLCVAAVDGPAVADDHAGEVLLEQLSRLVEAAAGSHVVGGGIVCGHHPQPGPLAADAPARLVWDDDGRAVHPRNDLSVQPGRGRSPSTVRQTTGPRR